MDYAKDIALVMIVKDLVDTELFSFEAISALKVWLAGAGLALVEEKTETVLITKRWKRNFARNSVENHIITSKHTIK